MGLRNGLPPDRTVHGTVLPLPALSRRIVEGGPSKLMDPLSQERGVLYGPHFKSWGRPNLTCSGFQVNPWGVTTYSLPPDLDEYDNQKKASKELPPHGIPRSDYVHG